MSGQSYTISADGKSITCLICGITSHHVVDVQERFCGRCKIFHNDSRERERLAEIRARLGLTDGKEQP